VRDRGKGVCGDSVRVCSRQVIVSDHHWEIRVTCEGKGTSSEFAIPRNGRGFGLGPRSLVEERL